MNTKAIISALILCINLFFVSNAQARPDLTPEQLAKVQEVASQMNPPVDFDALLDEADRLGVVCSGNFALRPIIKTCSNKVESAKLEEENTRLDEESAKLDEEYKTMGKEIKETLDETKEIASERLN